VILGSLIVVISILALAGMSFPVVRGVSESTRERAQRHAKERKERAERIASAAITKADRERRGLVEVDNDDEKEQRRRIFKQCALKKLYDNRLQGAL